MEHDLNLLYDDLLDINERVSKLPVYPQLGWVWCFDIIKDIFDNHQEADVNDEVVPSGVTLKQIFDKFYFDIDGLGINMDLGGEVLEEVIRDWMFENELLMIVEEEEDV
jgi:hypothetical protein